MRPKGDVGSLPSLVPPVNLSPCQHCEARNSTSIMQRAQNKVWGKRLELLFVAGGFRVSLEITGVCASLGGWDVPDAPGARARCVPTCCGSGEEPHTYAYIT